MSNLSVLESGRPLRSILITSTKPEEGKTTVTVNLAMMMALAGAKVMILDADLRKPQIHEVLGLQNGRGLSDIILEKVGVQDIFEVEQVVDLPSSDHSKGSLSVITSGNVIGVVGSALRWLAVKEAITHLTTSYDVVLLDSAPVLSVNDSVVLAPMVDGVLLLLGTGSVTEEEGRSTKERLERAGGHLLGVVMNRFDEKRHGPDIHPYRSYYM